MKLALLVMLISPWQVPWVVLPGEGFFLLFLRTGKQRQLAHEFSKQPAPQRVSRPKSPPALLRYTVDFKLVQGVVFGHNAHFRTMLWGTL